MAAPIGVPSQGLFNLREFVSASGGDGDPESPPYIPTDLVLALFPVGKKHGLTGTQVRIETLPQPEEPLSKIIPVLVAVLVCDAAVADRATGKKTLVGIFDQINVRSFPISYPMCLYMKITDAEGRYRFQIRFLKRDSEDPLATFDQVFEFKSRVKPADFYLEAPPLPIPSGGRYEFQVWANDIYLGGAYIDAVSATET